MQRTQKTFSLLQATAVISTLAMILWSTGVLSFRFAEAANLLSFSDVISDSAPAVGANHTLAFTTTQGLSAGDSIVVTLTGFDGIEQLTIDDIELTVDSVPQTIASSSSGLIWGLSVSGAEITLSSDSSIIGLNDEVIIKIGDHTASGTNQIINPAAGSYKVSIDLGNGNDTGTTMVMILDPVVVTASVDTIFTFTVSGVADAEAINDLTTTGTSSSDTIDFGTLTPLTPSLMAQDLMVETNAKEGFTISVLADQQLTSANGAVIDEFNNGTPIDILNSEGWAQPSGLVGLPETYGHWGFTAEVAELGFGVSPLFTAVPTVEPMTFFSHNGPTDGSSPTGLVRVGYQVEVSSLQEAANDYTATITYVATPVF